MSIAWHERDFAAEERERRLWQEQPVKRDAVAWASFITCCLICTVWAWILILAIGKVAMWVREIL